MSMRPPLGIYTITGVIVAAQERHITVRHADGWSVIGDLSVKVAVPVKVGDVVTFTAKFDGVGCFTYASFFRVG